MIITKFRILVPLKQFSNIWRTLEMLLIDFQISVNLTWFENCVISLKLYVPVVTLSTEDHIKLFKQLESGFKKLFYTGKNIDRAKTY